jgi:hypothetical protein
VEGQVRVRVALAAVDVEKRIQAPVGVRFGTSFQGVKQRAHFSDRTAFRAVV